MINVGVFDLSIFALGLCLLAIGLFVLKVSRLSDTDGNKAVHVYPDEADLYRSGLFHEHGMVASKDGTELKPQSKPSASKYDVMG